MQLRTEMNHRRKSDTYPSLWQGCGGPNQSSTCEQHGSFVLTLHLLCLWAKGSNFTQLLAAAENSLTGLLAFGSLSFNGLDDITVIYHS